MFSNWLSLWLDFWSMKWKLTHRKVQEEASRIASTKGIYQEQHLGIGGIAEVGMAIKNIKQSRMMVSSKFSSVQHPSSLSTSKEQERITEKRVERNGKVCHEIANQIDTATVTRNTSTGGSCARQGHPTSHHGEWRGPPTFPAELMISQEGMSLSLMI